MTKEESYYWKLWNDIFKKYNVKLRAEKEEWRKDITEQSLGKLKSHKYFTHSDYDIVLCSMRELFNTGQCVSSDITRAKATLEGDCKRYIYKIKQSAPDAYIRAISKDKFKTNNWERLNLNSLKMLLSTITRASYNRNKKSGFIPTLSI